MNNRKVLRAKRLLIPLVLPVVVLALWLGAIDARAQGDHFLYPAIIYDAEFYSDPAGNAGGTFFTGANVLSTEGTATCDFDGGWTYCGVSLAVERPDVDAVLGFVVDWDEAEVQSQTHARPEALGVDLSGQGSIFGGNSGCANVAECPTPYQDRWCMTDADPGDIAHLGCGEEPDIWLSDAVTGTHDSLAVYVVNTNGGTRGFTINVELFWIVLECPDGYTANGENVCVVDEGPPPPPPVEFPTCSFNYTATITTTAGTGTATYSYTVSANLIQNGSFEDADSGNYFPAFWTFVSDVPPLTNNWWGNSSLLAYSGVRYMDSYPQDQRYSLVQDLHLYSSGQYQAGFYARPSGHYLNSFGQVRMIWSGSVVAQSALITNTWAVFSGTRATGGGSAWLEMAYFTLVPGSSTDVYGDHAFIWPVDESGDILCDPDYYPVPPGQPISTTVPIDTNCEHTLGNICLPSPADNTCWNCQRPDNLLQIGGWISWLLCQIRNLFFCHLYNWLLNLGNWIAGLWDIVRAFFVWIPNGFSGIWNWFWDSLTNLGEFIVSIWNEFVSSGLGYIRGLIQRLLQTAFVQSIWNFVNGVNYLWDLFTALISLFLDVIRGIYNGILETITIVIDLVQAVREALLAEAYDWDFLPGFSGESEVEISREAAIADEGGSTWTETQAIYIFLMALAAGDAVLAEFGIQYIQILIIGAMSIGLIWWTLRKWEYILPV